MTDADRSNGPDPTPPDPAQSTEDEFPGETTLHRRVKHGEGFDVNPEDEPDAQPILTNDPMAGETVLPGIEGHDSGPVDRGSEALHDGADDSTATATVGGRDEDVIVDTAIDPRDLQDFDIDPLADGTEVSRPVYAESDLAGEEIDLADTPVHRHPVETDPPPNLAPEGLAGYDAPDDSPEPVIDITERDGPDLQRDH